MSRDISLDNPALQRQEDEFNRWPFSKRLADTIVAFDASEGAPVLGIFGKWGYGKSTILNFIKYELKQEHAEKVVTFEFNPWLFKDQEALPKEFFDGLATTLDQSLGSMGKSAGQFLAKYGGALQAIPLVGGGIGRAVEQAGKDLSTDSLQSQRARVIEIMRGADRTIVVLIDDLDRLDRDDILTVLKLVRLSANFPHVIYVLAFDDEMVARAAGEKYGGGTEWGRQFLEKIIQYPFSLPAIRTDRLVEFVLRRAKEACDFADIAPSDEDWKFFGKIATSILSARLGTPRQAIRYANSLRFALPMLKGEVDPLTQMLVEGLRTLFPELYAFARDKYMTLREWVDEGAVREIIKQEIMQGSSQYQIDAGYELLDLLEKNRSVFDPRYFDRYFSYAVDPGDIPERDMLKLIALMDEKGADAFVAELRRMAQNNATQLLDGLSSILSQLGSQQKAFLVRALAKEGLIFAQISNVPNDFLAKSALDFVRRVQRDEVNRGGDQLALWLKFIEQVEPLPLALQCVETLINENVIELGESRSRLRLRLTARIRSSSERKPLYLAYAPSDALRLLNAWTMGKSQVAVWLTKRLQEHPEEVEPFLNLFGTGTFDYQKVVRLVNPDVLSRIVTDRLALEGQSSDRVSASTVTWIQVAREFLSAREE